MPKKLAALSKAIEFLSQFPARQLVELAEYDDPECSQLYRPVQLLFPAAFVLHALSFVPAAYLTAQQQSWQQQLARYLQKQAHNYSYNYWPQESKLFLQSPLPDDLDDTACMYAALERHGIETDPRVFLKAMQLETKTGGPYTTWYVKREVDTERKWQDVDPVVNAHFLYLAKLYGIDLPGTEKYLVRCLRKQQISSQYYPSTAIFVFYLAKYNQLAGNRQISELLLQQIQKLSAARPAAIERLLLALSKLYLGEHLGHKELHSLMRLQQADGGLAALPMCFGFNKPDGSSTFVGSRANSTALFVELLCLQSTASDGAQGMDEAEQTADADWLLLQPMLNDLLSQVPQSRKVQEYLCGKQRPFGALLLPAKLAKVLKPKLSASQIQRVHNYGLAIFCGWLGYTLQDDILDGHSDTTLLPASNSLIRLSHQYLRTATAGAAQIETQVLQSFADTDNFYVWEAQLRRPRPPAKLAKYDYRQLAQRMSPFITAMSLLPQLIGVDTIEPQQLKVFFSAYCIIDQLNDDAHDWEADLKSGNITLVTWMLKAQKRKGVSAKKLFWGSVLVQVTSICTKLERQAQKAIGQMSLKPQQVDFLKALLHQSYSPIALAERELSKTADIIKYFKL